MGRFVGVWLVLLGLSLVSQVSCVLPAERVNLNTYEVPPRQVEVWHAGGRTQLQQVRVTDDTISGCRAGSCRADTSRIAIARSTIDSVHRMPEHNWIGVSALPVGLTGMYLLLRAIARSGN